MFITTHVAVAAPFGLRLPAPLAFVAGAASHLALDALPHWGVADRFHDDDRRRFTRAAVVDGVLGSALLVTLVGYAGPRRGPVLAGLAGATVLDANKPAELWFGRSPFPRAVDELHRRIQRERDTRRRLWGEVLAGAVSTTLAVSTIRRQPSRWQPSRRRRVRNDRSVIAAFATSEAAGVEPRRTLPGGRRRRGEA